MTASAIRTDSPIEEDFVAAMMAVGSGRVVFVPQAKLEQLKVKAAEDEMGTKVYMSSQVAIGMYRADFVLVTHFSAVSSKVLCVECDGEAFHRATTEQRLSDKARDNYMLARGVDTLRFSGARLKRDAFMCAREALARIGVASNETTTLGDSLGNLLKALPWRYSRAAREAAE